MSGEIASNIKEDGTKRGTRIKIIERKKKKKKKEKKDHPFPHKINQFLFVIFLRFFFFIIFVPSLINYPTSLLSIFSSHFLHHSYSRFSSSSFSFSSIPPSPYSYQFLYHFSGIIFQFDQKNIEPWNRCSAGPLLLSRFVINAAHFRFFTSVESTSTLVLPPFPPFREPRVANICKPQKERER